MLSRDWPNAISGMLRWATRGHVSLPIPHHPARDLPLWDTYEPSSPPSCGVCLAPGAGRGRWWVALGLQGGAPADAAQKHGLFFLSLHPSYSCILADAVGFAFTPAITSAGSVPLCSVCRYSSTA